MCMIQSHRPATPTGAPPEFMVKGSARRRYLANLRKWRRTGKTIYLRNCRNILRNYLRYGPTGLPEGWGG